MDVTPESRCYLVADMGSLVGDITAVANEEEPLPKNVRWLHHCLLRPAKFLNSAMYTVDDLTDGTNIISIMEGDLTVSRISDPIISGRMRTIFDIQGLHVP